MSPKHEFGADTSLGGPRRGFPGTSWSLVNRAGDLDDPAHRQHLEDLIGLYWRPAYGFIRARGWSVEDGKDLTQQFFAQMLERSVFGRLDPARGSFRAFLRRALANFLVDELRHRSARRPKDGQRLFVFDPDMDDAGQVPDAEACFEREWNNTVLRCALEDLEAQLADRKAYFEAFRMYFLDDPGEVPRTYAEVAAQLGISEAGVAKRLHVCRARLETIIRARVRDYIGDGEDLDVEVQRVLGG